ncbi:MAG TPA: 50S ribosomal protein L4 [Gaiellaceae bacterium]
MAAPKAPVLDASGKRSKDLTLEASVFAVEVKPHLVHETVRSELNARRAGTRAAKSRGLVSGGRSKPWRQKGTGRARAGTTRAPQWTGGGVAFAPTPRSFEVKVNRKVRRAALRAALAAHAQAGTFAVLADDSFGETPSTRQAAELLAGASLELPLLVVAEDDQEPVVKSFRNLPGVYVVTSAETEVAELVWARSVLVTEQSLQPLEGRAK